MPETPNKRISWTAFPEGTFTEQDVEILEDGEPFADWVELGVSVAYVDAYLAPGHEYTIRVFPVTTMSGQEIRGTPRELVYYTTTPPQPPIGGMIFVSNL